MNKHTRKKYPRAVREITVWEDAPKKEDGKAVSLFNETLQRADRLAMELLTANKRIQDLEKALAASRKVNEIAIKKAFASGPWSREDAPAHSRNLNALSDDETKQLFASLSVPDEYVDQDATERPATPWRDRVVGPLCALFRRHA